VLPKLREENARAKSGKGGKKKGWKDVVVEGMALGTSINRVGLIMSHVDDFEVAVFLTEVSTRHTLLRKEKRMKSEKARLGTVDGRLTDAGTVDKPLDVEIAPALGTLREESPHEIKMNLGDIPTVNEGDGRSHAAPTPGSEQSLFVSDDSADEDSERMLSHQPAAPEPPDSAMANVVDGDDDQKKMSFNTTYDGFSIYGRILCLVVKRRGVAKGKDPAGGSGQAMMEDWIASTQMGDAQLADG
jgi:hypothetical protein